MLFYYSTNRNEQAYLQVVYILMQVVLRVKSAYKLKKNQLLLRCTSYWCRLVKSKMKNLVIALKQIIMGQTEIMQMVLHFHWRCPFLFIR